MLFDLPFTAAELDQAHAQWGASCGHAALAAVCNLTLDQLRPHDQGRGYLSPSMMWDLLGALRLPWRRTPAARTWPEHGLARVQWEGPWCAPDVPPRAAYKYTHWIGARQRVPHGQTYVFDINAIERGGWLPMTEWVATIVPAIVLALPARATGGWHLTHVAEVTPREASVS